MHAKIAIIAFLILLNFTLTGQGTKEDKSSSGEGKETSDELNKKNIGNYLEKYHQTVLSENLKTRNLYNIHVLDIIVNNFGDQISGVKEELESIKKDYQVALRYYYRRAYMLSGPKMKENDRKIGDLFKKISNFYEAKSDNLLTECADAIVTVEQNETIEPGNEKNSRFRELSANQLRLKIAYYQMGIADRMNRDLRFFDSLTHYRIAKDYGISILSDLKNTEEEKKAILSKYQVDLSDNRNMVFRQANSKEPAKK